MAQITTGIRSLLSLPAVYKAFQKIMSTSREEKQRLIDQRFQAKPGDRVLDLGSGTSDILEFLPDVEYYGFDISESYIRAARARFGSRGTFEAHILTPEEAGKLQPFDICLTLGVLHHLDDDSARTLFHTAHAALRPGGRLFTSDPCYSDDQNPIARWLVSKDRGQNVRTLDGYSALAREAFTDVNAEIKHRTWIPYTHCGLECTRRA